MPSNVSIQRPRVAIIGAGFGGLSAAKSLARGPFNVVLIDRYNYHMFQPLLYQVAAKQQGAYVARVIAARAGGRPVAPFQYRDFGMLATIGRHHAVAQLGRVKLSGLPAWVLWCFTHIYFLIGFRSRLFVMLNWAWNFLSSQRGARLIIAMGGAPMTDIEHAEDRSSRTAREVA